MTDKPLLKERDLQIMDEIRESVSQDFKISKDKKGAKISQLVRTILTPEMNYFACNC